MTLELRLTEEEFCSVAARLRMGEQAQRMAWECLVQGVSPRVVAERYGVSRQAASEARRRVWSEYLRLHEVPEGWTVLKVRLPSDYARRLRRFEARLLRRWRAQQERSQS